MNSFDFDVIGDTPPRTSPAQPVPAQPLPAQPVPGMQKPPAPPSAPAEEKVAAEKSRAA